MASFLFDKYQMPWLKLAIGKPGAVHNAMTVGVEIERSRQASDAS